MPYATLFQGPTLELFAAAEHAARQIPPAFPLTATVAVNPFLGQADEPRARAFARLERTAGVRPVLPRADVAAMIADGRITDADLAAAAADNGIAPAELRAAAAREATTPSPLPTVADLARDASGTDWPAFVAERIGLWAAVHFDEGQALWPAPGGTPYSSWRAFASRDLTPGIAGLSGFAHHAASLPNSPREALADLATAMGLTPAAAEGYFHRLLLTLGGWAQIARGRAWLAERDGEIDDTLSDILTIALAWEAFLLAHYRDRIGPAWDRALSDWSAPLDPGQDTRLDAALQEAADRAAERRLATELAAPAADGASVASRPFAHAAFCIDVRSEVFRRALEAIDDGIETLGFAGFFGLPTAHRDAGSDLVEARAPVLLSPGLESTAALPGTGDAALRLDRRTTRAWGRFRLAAVSSFAFIESAGMLYGAKIVQKALGKSAGDAAPPPPALDLPLSERVSSAARILRAMSLTEGFGRLLVIVGHGANVTNAPFASALQCGACGGHAGDVNARLLARLLNDPEVRAALPEHGLRLPDDTVAVAGLHDTVSDTVTLFVDVDAPDHAGDLDRLRAALAGAGALARTDRAATLPRAAKPDSLLARGADWSEVRPEWGLAGCRAFVAAPRTRTRGRDLGGGVFLHSYDWRQDAGFGTLELILTAPVVVASWIALQYYGSTVAPDVFGGGNKLLHNVTGGLGVIEGAGGHLRTGLPWQSVHDGERPRHGAVRLSVVIEAPTAAISAVLDRHPAVRALFDNGWLSLHALDESGAMAWRYAAGNWQRASGSEAARAAA